MCGDLHLTTWNAAGNVAPMCLLLPFLLSGPGLCLLDLEDLWGLFLFSLSPCPQKGGTLCPPPMDPIPYSCSHTTHTHITHAHHIYNICHTRHAVCTHTTHRSTHIYHTHSSTQRKHIPTRAPHLIQHIQNTHTQHNTCLHSTPTHTPQPRSRLSP